MWEDRARGEKAYLEERLMSAALVELRFELIRKEIGKYMAHLEVSLG